MSQEMPVATLKEIADDARSLFEALLALAGLGKKTTKSQRRRIERLAKRLDTASRKASLERRRKEIEELGRVIRAHEGLAAIQLRWVEPARACSLPEPKR